MKISIIRLAAGLVLLASTASAQTADQLQCYKIKDSAAKAKLSADIAPLNTDFADAVGCEIKLPAKWLCLGAEPGNVDPLPTGPRSDEMAQSYLCYQTKCPGAEVTTRVVDLYGGNREVSASKTGMVCAPLAASCNDGIQNGTELGQDCGGACAPCSGNTACVKDGDCATNLCIDSVCVDPAHCSNGVVDADETATDCGGLRCGSCPDGAGCEIDLDCASRSCSFPVCAAATCSDGRKNQDETDIDCGGSLCGDCGVRAACSSNSDCATDYCRDGQCQYDFCFDGMPGMNETGTDCGGFCSACESGETCVVGHDCLSGYCDNEVCAPNACSDPGRNCGGLCEPCGPGGFCTRGSDCYSGQCFGGMCS